MKLFSLKTRILVPLTLALAVLLAAFGVSFYRFQQKHMNDMVVSKLESVQELFLAKLDSDAGMMGAALDAILLDEQLKAALKAKDRIALLDQSMTLFGQLNAEHGITHLYFTGPDRVNILRAHKPEKYGDEIDRFTTLEAEKTGGYSYGIELGPLGTFTLRVVQPWYDGQQLIGYVELGEEIEHVIRKLHRVLGVEIYVVIEKQYLDRAGWESGMRMLGRDANWNRFPSVVMIDHTLEEIPEGLTGFLAEEQHTSMKTDVDVTFNDRRYRTRFIHLNDAGDRGVGDMVVMTDVTDLVTDLRATVFIIGAICLGVGGILFALLLLFLQRVERQMATAHGKLIQVTKAVESTSDATVIINLSGQAVYQNRAFLKLFQYTVEELNEAGGLSILYDDSGIFREVFEVIRGGSSWLGEVEMQTRDGRSVSVSLRADAIKEETGEILGYVYIHTDITERKQAEEALHKMSEEQALLLDNIDTQVWYLTDLENHGAVNRALAEFLGVQKSDVAYKNMYDILSKEEAEVCIAGNREVFESKRQVRTEEWVKNGRGELRLLSISKTPKLDKDGNVEYVVCAAEDITERKRAEEAVRESEDRFRTLFNSASDAIFIHDFEGQMLEVNRVACDRLGYSHDELLQMTPKDFNSPEQASLIPKRLKELQQKGYIRFETAHVDRNGKLIPVEIISRTLDYKGKGTAISTARDIRERKRAEHALKESEQRYRLLVETMNDGLGVQDENGLLTYVNDRACQMIGYSGDEMIGRPVTDFLDDANQKILKEEMARRIKGEPGTYEIVWTGKDGRKISTIMSAQPILDDKGHFKGSFAVITDITEHKRVAEELKTHRDHLKELVAERTAELTKTNEQLQQQITERKRAEQRLLTYHKRLRSLASALSLAEERERRRIATQVHDLIGQNLAFAKMKLVTLLQETSSSSGRRVIDEVNKLVDEAIQDSRFLISELGCPILYELGFVPAVEWLVQQTQKRHGIAIDFEADIQPKPLSDDVRVLLFQAARELLANIARHGRADTAKVSITRTGDQIQVDVSDDGVGFDPAEIGPDVDESERFGLFSIRERLEPLGGHMEVASKPGHGTHVTLVGPLKSE